MALGNKTLDDLLGPISKQLEHDKVADHVDLPAWEFKPVRLTDGLSAPQLVDMFESEAEKIRVQVKRCSKDGLASCLASIVAAGVPDEDGPFEVVFAADSRFEESGAFNVMRAGQSASKVTVWDEEAGQANVDAAYTATFGITFAAGGIAETGTVVQLTSPQCGRAISLLPLVHVAVVEASAIVPTMGEAMAQLEQLDRLPSQVCFISGPSATADIELVRVEGVHGPMYVHYVIVG